MFKKFLALFVLLSVGSVQLTLAGEGMWPLTLINKLQDDMQSKGLKLTAEDIYSINKTCMKDAIVRLMSKQNRMFCTGEVISDQGLFLTNHHCGYPTVQELSTPEDNILQNGFWAKNMSEERPAIFNIGLLTKVEDVTSRVLDSININDEETKRAAAVAARITKIAAQLKSEIGEGKDNYVVDIIPFYSGNKFLAMYYQVFSDIRLVGVPPESIGKFGGETDNWEWPRHACDISLFRIYANKDNAPAAFSKDNQPFHPRYYFPVNIQGPKEKDYAMIMGYPGRTQRYTYSGGIKYYSGKERPKRVKVRRDVLDVYDEYMNADPKIKLMYSEKKASLANYWKKYMGEATALERLHIYDRRKEAENAFAKWVKDNNKTAVYGEVFDLYNKGYAQLDTFGLLTTYYQDAVNNSQPMTIGIQFAKLEPLLKDKAKADEATKQAGELAKTMDETYKEFYEPIEKKVMTAVLMHVFQDLDPKFLPKSWLDLYSKYKTDYAGMTEMLWRKSIFSSKEKVDAFLKNPSAKKLAKDPVYILANDYSNEINVTLKPVISGITNTLNRANRLFLNGFLEMNASKTYAPDANGTMRVTYGQVLPYDGKDAMHYKEFTTADGVMEKYIPGDIEFDAPARLIDMMKKKDFGPYADKDGTLHTCFITDNDITGGNSGSPVINGNGELIGTAFDGNWEAISSDFAFEPKLQRTISVDIRYTLFVIDKFGGASNLIKEMKVIQ
jgi:hypothetical protein